MLSTYLNTLIRVKHGITFYIFADIFSQLTTDDERFSDNDCLLSKG